MYIGIDIGGTKTLIAALTNEGVIHESLRFPTPPKYDDFLAELKSTVANITTKDFRAGAVAAPGEIDRDHGVFMVGGNLKWKHEHIQRDVERIVGCPMLLENDANLAGLSEAMLLRDKHAKVLYLTISTGIGGGFIVDQKIEPNMADIEPGHMMLQRGHKLVKWESFASGKAIYEKYRQKASDIEDPAIWKAIVKDWVPGFLDLIAVTEPDVIVLGGGVGHYLPKYHDFLVAGLEEYSTPLTPIPPIIKAQRPEEAVVYGCYDLARSIYA
ncbi:MAG TPA: ROK family protein [Candidatus Saccharimonadales bacterium]|nr:ROK family protein [Candidatus Saccharimonadales bacterium]